MLTTVQSTKNECDDWEVVDGDETEEGGWVNVSKAPSRTRTQKVAADPTTKTATMTPTTGFVRSSKYDPVTKSFAHLPSPPPPPPSPDMMVESQLLPPPPKRDIVKAPGTASTPMPTGAPVIHQAPGRKAGVLPSWNDPPHVIRSGKCGTFRHRERLREKAAREKEFSETDGE